jgi:hypothetical protein
LDAEKKERRVLRSGRDISILEWIVEVTTDLDKECKVEVTDEDGEEDGKWFLSECLFFTCL